MSDQRNRLIRCFAAVFPTLTIEEILVTSVGSVGVWDSLATVKLAAVIEEEFEVPIDLSGPSKLDSFEAFETYLRQRTPA